MLIHQHKLTIVLLFFITTLLSWSTNATASGLYWAPLPTIPASVKRVAAQGEFPIILTTEGALYRLEGQIWSALAPPTPERPDNIFVSDDAIWVWMTGSPYIRRFQNGSWKPQEMLHVPISDITQTTDKRLFAVTTRGRILERTTSGWVTVPEAHLSLYDEQSLRIFASPDGGVWVAGGKRVAGFLDSKQFSETDLGQNTHMIAVTAEGLIVASSPNGVSLMNGNGTNSTLVIDQPVSHSSIRNGTVWLSNQSKTWRLAPDTDPTPFPGELVSIAGAGSQLAFAADAQGTLYRTKSGTAPAFSNRAEQLGIATFTDGKAISSADFNDDGYDDIVSIDSDGQLKFALQTSDGFVDGGHLFDNTVTGVLEDVMACDLDNSGRADLITKERNKNNSSVYRYYRALDGWFEEVTEFGGLVPARYGPSNGSGRIKCLDIDSDNDLDLLIFSGMGNRNGLTLFENIGFGRLNRVSLPARGLGAATRDVRDMAVGDIDGDGLNDIVVLSANAPHLVLHGEQNRALRNVSAQSGLGLTNLVVDGWLIDLDGDTTLDLITIDAHVGPRVWKNNGDNSFSEHSHDLIDSDIEGWSFVQAPTSFVAHFGKSNTHDLVTCTPSSGCRLFSGTDKWREVSDALPHDQTGIIAGTTLDIGADGDTDIYLVREGDNLLWENFRNHPSTAQNNFFPANRRGIAINLIRKTVWARPLPDLLLSLILIGALLASGWILHLRDTRIALGKPLVYLCVTAFGIGTLYYTAEWQLISRSVISVSLGASVLLATWLEIRADIDRSARRVAGYRLDALLGHGGMGTVYLGHHQTSGEKVAVKIVHPELLAREEDRNNFRREATVGSMIRDPRVVNILEWGECTIFEQGNAQQTAYLVMEHLHGLTLSAYLARQGGILQVPEAVAIITQVLLGLQTLHEAGIVHRDIKPDNVMLLPTGEVKLMDLGAARAMGKTTKSTRQVLGTLGYVAPEQGRGKPPDLRSDIYASGVLLYEMLAGSRPFKTDDLVELLQQILHNPPPPISGLDTELQHILLVALAKEPDERPQTATDFAKLLSRFEGQFAGFDKAVVSTSTFSLLGGSSVTTDGNPEDSIGPLQLTLLFVNSSSKARRLPSAMELVISLTRYSWHQTQSANERSKYAQILFNLAGKFDRSDSAGHTLTDQLPGFNESDNETAIEDET